MPNANLPSSGTVMVFKVEAVQGQTFVDTISARDAVLDMVSKTSEFARHGGILETVERTEDFLSAVAIVVEGTNSAIVIRSKIIAFMAQNDDLNCTLSCRACAVGSGNPPPLESSDSVDSCDNLDVYFNSEDGIDLDELL